MGGRKTTKGMARKSKGKRRNKRSSNAVTGGPNTCRLTETFQLSQINLNTPEEYNFLGIPAGSRAAAVAPNFGLYRIAKVTYTIRPMYDTYTPNLGQAGGGQVGNQPDAVPYLYWKMNRYGDAPANFTGEFLREQGSKAIRLDDKNVVFSYKPNILLADAGATAAGLQGGSGQVKMTPWLSTDARVGDQAYALSQTVHYGHIQIVEGAASGNALPVIANVEAKVVIEFKNPRGITSSQSVAPTNKKVIMKNAPLSP